jgi:hypothetical protein
MKGATTLGRSLSACQDGLLSEGGSAQFLFFIRSHIRLLFESYGSICG